MGLIACFGPDISVFPFGIRYRFGGLNTPFRFQPWCRRQLLVKGGPLHPRVRSRSQECAVVGDGDFPGERPCGRGPASFRCCIRKASVVPWPRILRGMRVAS